LIARASFPGALLKFWWVAFVLGGVAVVEQVWEQTFLTWRHGPQMIGFTLLHVYPELAILGIIGYYLMIVWLLTAASFLAIRKAFPVPGHLPFLFLPLIAIALSVVPYSFWASLGGVQV
jgi:hypothetical protein